MSYLLRAAMATGIIFLYRWMLHLSTPKSDWRLATIYMYELERLARRGFSMARVWLISLVRYVPSKKVEKAWIALRDQVAQGRYGTAGT